MKTSINVFVLAHFFDRQQTLFIAFFPYLKRTLYVVLALAFRFFNSTKVQVVENCPVPGI